MEKEGFTEFQAKLLKLITFVMTFASMILGLSLIPLLPQPLPIIISFLIAFAVFKNPKYGMCIGSVLIGLGLIYHLSRINFIAMMGEPDVRVLTILVMFFAFLILPLSINHYEDAITVSVGIITASTLFFQEVYFLAIPLIIIFAVLYRKARLGLTLSYYVLISVPLQAMQYVKYIFKSDLKTYPLIYGPLTDIYKDIQVSMNQVTFSEIYRILEAIAGQITLKTGSETESLKLALLTYENSLPGLILFLVIVSGLVSAVALITLGASRLFKGVELTKKYAKYVEIFLPAVTSVATIVLFFLLINGLQDQLAFTAQIDSAKIALSTLASIVITVPASVIDYRFKMRTEIERRSKILAKKAQELLSKLQEFEELLMKVKISIPVTVSSIEGKMTLIKDELNDILNKAKSEFFDLQELDEKFEKIDKELANSINNLTLELNVLVEEYQVYTNLEYSTWVKKFKELGIEAGFSTETVPQGNLTLDAKLDAIKKVLEDGRSLANDVIKMFERIYTVIRSLFDPNLPQESPTVSFAKQKLDETSTPWIALDALFASFNNLERQYGDEIVKSAEQLENSLNLIVNLSEQNQRLTILTSGSSELMEYAEKAQEIQGKLREKAPNVMKIMMIEEAFESSLSLAVYVLGVFYKELKHKEGLIEGLLPTKDYGWEKNATLTERMASALEVITNPSNYKLNVVMENLHKSLSYVEECIETITFYNEKYELLLNYPIAELAIEEMLRQKKRIFAHDLPFELKFAEEYLKIYYMQRRQDFIFNEAEKALLRRA
ncbi:MAG: hypothetical protein ACPLW5_00610 [Candidatus Bathyarchaeales archaeon]